MTYQNYREASPKEKIPPSPAIQLENTIEVIAWLFRTWKIPSDFQKTFDAINKAQRNSWLDIVDADFRSVLQGFSRWVQSLQWNTPKGATWGKKYQEIADALAQALRGSSHSWVSVTYIQAQVTGNPTIKTTPKTSTLDRWSQKILDDHAERIIKYLKENWRSLGYDPGKKVTLYVFGKYLQSIDFPTTLSYENGIIGDITSDIRHPFWTALWEKLRNSGYSLKLSPSREGMCIIVQRISQNKSEPLKSSQPPPVESNFISKLQSEVLWESSALEIIQKYDLVLVVQRLHDNGVSSTKFWDLLTGVSDMNIRTLISPPKNRALFIGILNEICKREIWLYCWQFLGSYWKEDIKFYKA